MAWLGVFKSRASLHFRVNCVHAFETRMTNVSFTVLLSTFAVHHSTVASLVTWPCLDQSDLPGVADGFVLFFCQSTPFHAAAAAGRHALRSCNTFSRFMTSAHAAAASTRAAKLVTARERLAVHVSQCRRLGADVVFVSHQCHSSDTPQNESSRFSRWPEAISRRNVQVQQSARAYATAGVCAFEFCEEVSATHADKFKNYTRCSSWFQSTWPWVT